jgi:hypothetical protein
MVAMINRDECPGIVYLTIDDVAVIANLAFVSVHNAIAAPANLDAHGLIGCTLLPLLAAQAKFFTGSSLGIKGARSAQGACDGHRSECDAEPADLDPAFVSDSMHDVLRFNGERLS